MANKELRFNRILLKLSGEALGDKDGNGISAAAVASIIDEIIPLHTAGIQIAIVVGAGNLFRGQENLVPPAVKNKKDILTSIAVKGTSTHGFGRATGDYMGMLATVMNALALQNQFEHKGIHTRMQSAITMQEVCEPFILRRAIRHLEKNRIVIFGAGTGHPFFTTDTAAALRAIEIGADVIIKATKVDGIYDSDPKTNPLAQRFETISYMDVIERGLKVMDATAISLCMDNALPIIIFDFFQNGNLVKIINGEKIGSFVGG